MPRQAGPPGEPNWGTSWARAIRWGLRAVFIVGQGPECGLAADMVPGASWVEPMDHVIMDQEGSRRGRHRAPEGRHWRGTGPVRLWGKA